jgi:sterol desaturase/sphingolipid hydroxylase (fatty acid hydroxylase superfamily)
MLLGINGAGVILATAGGGRMWLLVPLGFAAVAVSLAAERLIPYEPDWNLRRGETRRDITHAVVNQSIQIIGVATLPLIVWATRMQGPWPSRWPFLAQVAMAIIAADAGITLIHYASHHVLALWRFHAAHHSITRFYGLNGLLEHPVNTVLEMLGAVPLILMGLPVRVAAAIALCGAVQLMLQHSNADYHVGPLRYLLALNQAHRFHHLKSSPEGNVNFGLFTVIWDHLLGTFADDQDRRFTSAAQARPRHGLDLRLEVARRGVGHHGVRPRRS